MLCPLGGSSDAEYVVCAGPGCGPFQYMQKLQSLVTLRGRRGKQGLALRELKVGWGGEAGSAHKYFSGRTIQFPYSSKACMTIPSPVPITTTSTTTHPPLRKKPNKTKLQLLENKFVVQACILKSVMSSLRAGTSLHTISSTSPGTVEAPSE